MQRSFGYRFRCDRRLELSRSSSSDANQSRNEVVSRFAQWFALSRKFDRKRARRRAYFRRDNGHRNRRFSNRNIFARHIFASVRRATSRRQCADSNYGSRYRSEQCRIARARTRCQSITIETRLRRFRRIVSRRAFLSAHLAPDLDIRKVSRMHRMPIGELAHARERAREREREREREKERGRLTARLVNCRDCLVSLDLLLRSFLSVVQPLYRFNFEAMINLDKMATNRESRAEEDRAREREREREGGWDGEGRKTRVREQFSR